MCYVNDDGALNNYNCDNANCSVRAGGKLDRVGNKPKTVRHHLESAYPFLHRINTKEQKMTDYEKVSNFQNLYKSYKKSRAGRGSKMGSCKFDIMALDGIRKIKEQLEHDTYEVSGYHEFMVYQPKERIIKACSLKDKIVQHSLCDNVLLPDLKSEFIESNFAGQEGKGTLFGLDHLRTDMFDFYNEHGEDGYILKCDIRKFFYSIDHKVLKDIVKYHVCDTAVQRLCDIFIDSTDGSGIPLGNQVSQVYALLMLNGMDKMITGELGIYRYGRYMDDFYLIHENKEYLKYCLRAIEIFVTSLGLQLNGKTQIIPFRNGIDFLGFHTYITSNGRAIRKLKNQNKRNIQKKYRKMAKMVIAGKLSREKFSESYTACKAHMSHGNTKKLVHSLDMEIGEILK